MSLEGSDEREVGDVACSSVDDTDSRPVKEPYGLLSSSSPQRSDMTISSPEYVFAARRLADDDVDITASDSVALLVKP